MLSDLEGHLAIGRRPYTWAVEQLGELSMSRDASHCAMALTGSWRKSGLKDFEFHITDKNCVFALCRKFLSRPNHENVIYCILPRFRQSQFGVSASSDTDPDCLRGDTGDTDRGYFRYGHVGGTCRDTEYH
jgi:hypothetical protein